MSPIPIDTDSLSEVACVSLKPSGEDVNTTITTTPVRITTVENHTQASSTVTVSTSNSFSCVLVDHTPKAVGDTTAKPSGEDVNTTITTTPVRITTVENHTQASSTVTVSTTNSFSCVLVDHTPKAMRDTAAKRSIPKARLLTSAESLALLQE